MSIKMHLIAFLKIITFLILFGFVFVILTYISKPPATDLDNIAGLYGEDKNSLDMVYIGGSAAFIYWEPLMAFEDTGMTSYVYSSNTIQIEFYKTMIKEILDNQNPEVIVIDARAFQYRDIDQPPAEVPYRNFLTGLPFSMRRAIFIENNVSKYLNEDTLSYHFDIIKYHTFLADILSTGEIYDLRYEIKNRLDMMLNKYKNSLKGFGYVEAVNEIVKTDYYTDAVTLPSNETDLLLDELLDYLDSIDTNIIFIVSPYEELESHKEIFNYVANKVTDRGHVFIDANDYRDEMGLNYKTDFYNVDHVNIFGADKYTNFLENYIVNNYDIVDHRDDVDYKEWNDLLDEWHILSDNVKENTAKMRVENES